MHLTLQAPDVNTSQYLFINEGRKKVLYGLGAIKGVGLGVIEGIVNERKENGSYRDLFDLCRRNDPSKLKVEAMPDKVYQNFLKHFKNE